MRISDDDVLHIAELARIKIVEENDNTEKLSEILNYVENLEKAPTGGDEKLVLLDLENAGRKDSIEKSLDVSEVLKNAPDCKNGFFKVKKVFEE